MLISSLVNGPFFVFNNRSLGLIDASIRVIQLLQKLENDLESLLIGKYWATAATTILQIIPQNFSTKSCCAFLKALTMLILLWRWRGKMPPSFILQKHFLAAWVMFLPLKTTKLPSYTVLNSLWNFINGRFKHYGLLSTCFEKNLYTCMYV